MRRNIDAVALFIRAIGVGVCSLCCVVSYGQPAAAEFGIEKRIPWTTSHVKGSPEPPSPFITEQVFKKLNFREPLEMVALPGTKRLVMAEHAGRIFSFLNDPEAEKTDVFADMKKWKPEIQEVYSVAFHPQFASNRFVYIWYILKPELPDGTHISRFRVSDNNPPTVDLSTEVPIIAWKSGGHNGGCMRFGKDGNMYISTGDGVGPAPPDTLKAGQDISELLSSILRIDVDHAEAGKNYKIPPDNPFVHLPNARPEVWAYGLRNPWRMSIDQKTGDVWVGDVGWELWEMIYRVQSGGNYGWSIMEGSRQVIHADWPRGPTPILPPIVEHPHSEAASITGGFVYRGKRLPQLYGAYIYGDYQTGKIWELRYDGSRVTKHRELVDTPYSVVSFAEDHEGELYFIHYGGTVHRLAPNPEASKVSHFPKKLSETGLFASMKSQQSAPGVVPFSVNSEVWSDGAIAERVVAIPGTNNVTQSRDGNWIYPKDSVWAKTLSVERNTGNPGSQVRIETQLIHFDGDNWNAYTYRWNDSQTDATLVRAAGEERVLTIQDKSAPGGKRKQTWHYSSRAECLRCHNSWCNTLLAYIPGQLNRSRVYKIGIENRNAPQLRTLAHIGLAPESMVRDSKTPAYANPKDTTAKLEMRARGYLHANCSHCHRENAGGAVMTFMNYEYPIAKANLVDGKPTQGDMGIPGARVAASGDPYHSVLFYRMSKLGKGHMPYLGSSVVDQSGLNLIHDWISGLPPDGRANGDDMEKDLVTKLSTQVGSVAADRTKMITKILSSVSGALRLTRAIDEHVLPPLLREAAITQGSTAVDPSIRDLFERFLPEEKRIKTLGTIVDSKSILSLKGDVNRGRAFFSQEGRAQCKTCHRAENAGRDFGPDLSHIGKKYTPPQLLEQILFPNKVIDPKFVAYAIETADDINCVGFILQRTDKEVVVKDATAVEKRIPLARIKEMKAQKLSLMPEGLLQSMTASDAADLIAYLSSLK